MNDFGLITSSLFGGGILSLFLLGFFTTRVGNHAILAGMLLAVLGNVYLMLNSFNFLPAALCLPIHSYWTTILVNAVALTAGYLASFLWPNRKQLDGLTIWTAHRTGESRPE